MTSVLCTYLYISVVTNTINNKKFLRLLIMSQ